MKSGESVENNTFNDKGYYIQFLDDTMFENFEKIISEEIIEICCGYCNCNIYEIPEIANEFLQRVNKKNSKDNRHKIGYIGELLYYVFAKYKFPFLKSINPMINIEERSFKKGFDMLSVADNTIWYSEVKSGELLLPVPPLLNKMNIEKLSTAYSDISSKLDGQDKNTNYWTTAKAKLCLCTNDTTEIENLAKILDSDMKLSKIKNKIIVSVIFGKTSELINENKVAEKLHNLRKKDENLIIVCIREQTLDRTINVIKELCKNG